MEMSNNPAKYDVRTNETALAFNPGHKSWIGKSHCLRREDREEHWVNYGI